MTEDKYFQTVRDAGGDPELYRSALAGLRYTWTRPSGDPEIGHLWMSMEDAGMVESRVVTVTRENGSYAGSYREFRRVKSK